MALSTECSHLGRLDPLIDNFNRTIRSVRISVTDRCNFRCVYCMPEEGIEWQKKESILSFEEIVRIIKIVHSTGINKIRLTGGEPTIREGFIELCDLIASICPNIDLAITTNGVKLKEQAIDLKKAGVRRLNISIDTLDRKKFHEITRRNQLENVIAGINEANKVGFPVIKLNAVAIKGFNQDELFDFIDFSEKTGMEFRFIELMPFTGNKWEKDGFISKKEILELVAKKEKFVELPMRNKSQTSVTYSLRDGKAKLGFIASVTESFCSECDRIRITADGNVRSCLHSSNEDSLRDVIRSGGDDNDIYQVLQKNLSQKWKEHPDFTKFDFKAPVDDRAMILIGG